MSIPSYSVTVTFSEEDHQLLDAFAAERQISDPAEALRILLHESADLSNTLREDKAAYSGAVLDRLSAQIDEGIAVWLSADFAPDSEPFPDDLAVNSATLATAEIAPSSPFTADTVMIQPPAPESDFNAETMVIHPPAPDNNPDNPPVPPMDS